MARVPGSDGSRSSDPDDEPLSGEIGRRKVLRAATVGAAVVWVTPVVLSLDTPAASATTIVAPVFVTGSEAQGFDGPSISDKSITLTSNNVQAGDLWIGILAYDYRGTITAPSGPGWSVSAVFSGGTTIYSVESMVVWRVLVAADIAAGSFTQTFAATGADLTYGGFRGAGLAYRGTNLVAAVNGDGVSRGAGLGANANVTFPTASPAGTNPNVVVRLGAARGYGGYNATDPIHWTSWPGTGRADYDGSNFGDRALVISEQTNNTGASAGGVYHTSTWGARNRATFTGVIRNGP